MQNYGDAPLRMIRACINSDLQISRLAEKVLAQASSARFAIDARCFRRESPPRIACPAVDTLQGKLQIMIFPKQLDGQDGSNFRATNGHGEVVLEMTERAVDCSVTYGVRVGMQPLRHQASHNFGKHAASRLPKDNSVWNLLQAADENDIVIINVVFGW